MTLFAMRQAFPDAGGVLASVTQETCAMEADGGQAVLSTALSAVPCLSNCLIEYGEYVGTTLRSSVARPASCTSLTILSCLNSNCADACASALSDTGTIANPGD
jgi:hypothetical protein